MASCCPPGSAPYLAADHTDQGSVRSVNDVPFYQVGSGERGLLIIADVWGWNGGRTRALADELSKKGLSVWVPKILVPPLEGGTDGDGLPPTFDIGKRGSELGPLLGGDWNASKTLPKVMTVITAMKSGGIKKMGIIGVCYGAWIGMKVAKESPISLVGCASPHPSLHIEGMLGGDPVALSKGSKCPWAFFPCGTAGAAGADGEMYDAEGDVFKALEEKFPGKNTTKRYSSMIHGFWPRGSIKESEFNAGTGEEVEKAVEECTMDILRFFVQRGLTSRAMAGLPPMPPKLKKPKFIKVAKITPEASGLNLMLKCVKCEEVTSDGGAKVWEAVLGDDTGVVTFSLRNETLVELCTPGASVRVQNARVLMLKGYIRVIIDKWAVLKATDETLDFEPNSSLDISGTEYELV